MKRLSIFMLVLSLALVMSCSKEEVEEPVDNSEPVVPMTRQELTGEFEGEWMCKDFVNPTQGVIVVNDGYIFIDDLPVKITLENLISYIRLQSEKDPNVKTQMTESIGNFFFASSYKYPMTDLQVKYKLGPYSYGAFSALISSVKNRWSDITTHIFVDREPPYPSETIVIGPSEPNTISFVVEADDIPYRVDMVGEGHEFIANFRINDSWTLQYWYKTYRISNLMTGQQYEWNNDTIFEFYGDKEDYIRLQFHATKRTGSAEERIIAY